MASKIYTFLPYLTAGTAGKSRAELCKFLVPYGFAKLDLKEMAFKEASKCKELFQTHS